MQLKKLGLLSTLLLILAAAGCQDGSAAQTGDQGTVPAVFVTATPSRTAVPSPTIEPTILPTLTSTQVPSPTTEKVRRLPINWREFGNDRFGIVIPAPRSWVDATHILRQPDSLNRFGPLMLLLVDDEETAKRLEVGVPTDKGAYVFAYVGKSIPQTADPALALSQVLIDLGVSDALVGDVVTVADSDVPMAYADVNLDPLSVFPLVEQRLRYRIVLFMPVGGTPAIMVLATSARNWDTYANTFSNMIAMAQLPQVRDRVLGHINSDESVDGNLLRETSDIWTFNGRQGTYATIALSPNDTRIDLTLTLIDPEGNLVVSVDDGYEGDLEVITDILLPLDGTYIIEAREFFNEIGRYELNLLLSEEAQHGGGGPIDIGGEISSELVENGEHIWTFGGTASQEITIVLTSLNDQLDVILELYGPDGSFLGLWDEGFAGDAEVITGFELPITGDYSIIVHGFAGHGGRYQLLLEEGSDDTTNLYDAGDLIAGDAQREYLREDEVHAWFFSGQAGDDIVVQVSPLSPNMDLEISLVDATVTEYLVSSDESLSGESETISFTLPSEGQYLAVIREFFGEPGEYEISLDSSRGQELEVMGPIALDQSVEGRLIPGLPAGWIFDGLQDQTITIVLTPLNPDKDLVLELIDPQGESAAFMDGSLTGLPERLVNFELVVGGQWTIIIREFFGEASDYELSLYPASE